MTSPTDVAAFHADYDRHHPDDRLRLFGSIGDLVSVDAAVLYPGSYVDIGPSIWFDDVTYVDTDKRAARFFGEHKAVTDLIKAKRLAAGRDPVADSGRDPGRDVDPDADAGREPKATFHHLDYREQLPVDDGTVDLLVSLYAGFISEHCIRYVRPGGLLLANNSHGDASMASLDARTELVAVVKSRDGGYRVTTSDLDDYLQPKRGEAPSKDELHKSNRGVAFTKPGFAYLFRCR